jgi:hypothetical protein
VIGWDYEHAYPGAPPPGGLIPLARPLYPPDANRQGKKPSSNGPDVEAIKRGISRGGRWPWQNFDQAWSNGFAHGSGPDVIDSGVAGFQRQMDIDDTGWWGTKSNNALQYALIPDGLPHAGEHLLDDTARNLLRQAWNTYKGHEPAPEEKSLRERALAQAITQIGVKESPPDSNQVKYCSWYGMVGPWCAMFVTWSFETIGGAQAFVKGSRYAYVPYIVSDARAGKYGLKTTDEPIPGDLACYDWEWNGEYDHIGVFEKWLGGGDFNAIEGNTSYGNDSNGGEVMRRSRNRSSQSTVFVRVG